MALFKVPEVKASPVQNSFVYGPDATSEMLRTCKLNKAGESTVLKACAKIIQHKNRYESIGLASQIPWWVIAVIHHRENGNDFSGVLHNGERIIGKGVKTKLVPAGRGPFSTFEEAAIDALSLTAASKVGTWNVPNSLDFLEKYNGLGYRKRGLPSPYLWSFTSKYVSGKYVKDGVFDSKAVDKQIGCVALMLGFQKLGVHLPGVMLEVHS